MELLLTCRIITIFPELIQAGLRHGILRQAQERGKLRAEPLDLRDFAQGKHRQVDDYPYGGGPGMALKPEPVMKAVEHAKRAAGGETRVLFMTPQGAPLTQNDCERLSMRRHLIILCGRYKGVDERARACVVDEEISVGDYVLSGGELPALTLLDAVARLLPGAIGDAQSAMEDSFASGLLEGRCYTRPAEWNGLRVPDILLSGDPVKIAEWRRRDSLRRTMKRRPDLLKQAELTEQDKAHLKHLQTSEGDDHESHQTC